MKDKALWKFILILVICAIGGGVVGFIVAGTENSISGVGDILTHLIIQLTPMIIPGAGVLFTILFFIFYLRANRNYKMLDEENEAVFDAIEHQLSLAVAMTSVGTILLFIFMGIMATNSDDYSNKTFFLMMTLFICFILFFAFMQRKVVSFEKRLNPEKRGDVLNLNFQKEWFESCDEYEKMAAYKACYKSYKALQISFLVVFVLLIILGSVFRIGVLPYIIVGSLWLVHTITYLVECTRESKGKSVGGII